MIFFKTQLFLRVVINCPNEAQNLANYYYYKQKKVASTLFEIFLFCPKFNFDFARKLLIFWEWKTRENVAVLDFLAIDNFDFTRKIVKKILVEKLAKMLGICTFLVVDNFDFPRKLYSFVKIEFLDKNLTFRIVCQQSNVNCSTFKPHKSSMDFKATH